MTDKEFKKVLRKLCLGIKARLGVKERIKENVMKRLALMLTPLLILVLLFGGCGSSRTEELQEEIDRLQIELAESEANSANSSSPRNFDSEAELIEWREKTGIVGSGLSWVDSCVLLHEIALKEGYLVTLDVDVYEGELGVSLTSVAGERFYQVYPDEIEVYFIAFVY